MKKKLRKLRREPKKFFVDMKILKIFSTEKKVPEKKVPEKKVPEKKSIKEPLLFGNIYFKNKLLEFELYKKAVININLGFSSLVITEDNNDYLINKPYISLILREKNFIAFKNKSLYFLKVDELLNGIDFTSHQLNSYFLNNEELRQNKFSQFRNLITINPMNPIQRLLKYTNPNLRSIVIIDNLKSLEYIQNHTEEIDVLIIYDKLNIENIKNIPRLISFSDAQSFLNVLKIVLIDTSYKTDSNLLLPIISKQDNLKNIDIYNENKSIQGLIKFTYNNNNEKIETFNDILNFCTIEELFLRENFYSIYKDIIYNVKDKNDVINLVKLSLKDGVFYETI